MNNKLMYTIIGALGVVSAIVAAFFVFAKPQKVAVEGASTQDTTQAQTQVTTSSNSSSNEVSLTADELAQHSSSSDCYIAYKNTVYDITSFVPQHEGGPQIIQYCGQVVDDFSSLHPGGSFDSPRVQRVLDNLVIGKLSS